MAESDRDVAETGSDSEMGRADVRFEVDLSTLCRLLFIVGVCAPFWFTVAAGYAKKMRSGTTRASRMIARLLTALLWGDLTYSLFLTGGAFAFIYSPRQPVLDCVLFVSSWPSVLVWWLLRLLIRLGSRGTQMRSR